MHEYHLVKSVVNTILEKTAQMQGLQRVTGITLKLGHLKMVTKESFQQVFNEVSQGTVCEGAQLHIEEVEGDQLTIEKIEGEFKED